MKNNTRRYHYFEQYCLRNPIFSFNYYATLTKKETLNFNDFQTIWKDKTVKEALFLASQNLYKEIDKYLSSPFSKENTKLQSSFLKYLSRMSSRCTPFGLFAGCSVGNFASHTNIEVAHHTKFSRQTKFDMNFLVALSIQLAENTNIKQQLLFYPNTSIYKGGNHLRYVEYKYVKNHRIHNLEAVSNTRYLNLILEQAKTGKKLKDLAQLLISDTINVKEANQFIETLVENQLLISELEPTVSGTDFLEQIINTLSKLKNTEDISTTLQNLSNQLTKLDVHIGNHIATHKGIIDEIKKLKTTFELKYLFQTDLFPTLQQNTLSNTILKNVKEGLIILNKMSVKNNTTNLSSFKKAFVKRYEQDEVPLTLALDIEMGIGYIQNQYVADDTPLLDDLFLPSIQGEQSLSWNKTQNVLHKKLLQNNNNYILELTAADFKDFKEDWNDLPDTLATLAEIITIDGKEKVFFNAVNGSSAANLLGRFANGSKDIHQLIKNIVKKEEELQPNKILAEIVHLPQARTGNILKRPQFRAYEIPYLAKSNALPENQISINDLYLSVKDNKIVLFSKKHQKEVIPHLSNAHNYSKGLPIYHFLCDLQHQDKRDLYFSWGNASLNQKFLPRVVYKEIIFFKASWTISHKELANFNNINNAEVLIKKTDQWRKTLKMPQYVQFIESDNTLLVNFKNSNSIKMLLDSIKKRKEIILEEFLFSNSGIVKSKQNYYTNQVVLSFYKTANSYNKKIDG